MQLICRHDVDDYATWKHVYDGDREDRAAAGLRQLQIWRDADRAGRVWLLFEISDRARAEAFLKDPKAAMHAERAGVRDGQHHFLNTA